MYSSVKSSKVSVIRICLAFIFIWCTVVGVISNGFQNVYAESSLLSTYKFDFGTESSPVEDGYIKVSETSIYDMSIGYGFTVAAAAYDRGTEDLLTTDFCICEGTFIVDIPHGDYTVSVISGDESDSTDLAVQAEGIDKLSGISLSAGEYTEQTFTIVVIDEQLNLEFSGTNPKINAIEITKLPDREEGDKPTVYIAGDSTVQTYNEYWRPQAGWGQMIDRYFTDDVIFDNQAIGGRSSKSFIVEGRLDSILSEIRPNDYLFIQFGHNDATISKPERYASPEDYKVYLKTYVDGTRQHGAVPVLITPVGRRDFNEDGSFNVSFPEYVSAMKEVAEENDVKMIDLSSLSVAYYNSIGVEATLSVFLFVEPGMYQAFPDGKEDSTHFQEYGAIQISRLVAGAAAELELPISSYVEDTQIPSTVPDIPLGLDYSSISNATVGLEWEESEGADLYNIYRKTVEEGTSNSYEKIGTSTVNVYTDSGLSEGITYSYRVSAVNGKGESEMSDEIIVTTKEALLKYDFGSDTSPVADGYSQVSNTTLYDSTKGYGFDAVCGFRDRGEPDDLLRDFCLSSGYTFSVDLEKGDYSVKIISGDNIASNRTSASLEGVSVGTLSSGKASFAEKTSTVQVTDGQLNILFGDYGRVNAIEITPLLQAPTQLTMIEKTLSITEPSVLIGWESVEDAALYNLYRSIDGDDSYTKVGSTTENNFTDTSIEIGMTYNYKVSAVGRDDSESPLSESITVEIIDPDIEIPSAPTGLALQNIEKNSITISWNPVDDSIMYKIYRSKSIDGTYEMVGSSMELEYTDDTVLTTIPYYYKVCAVNLGGFSEKSDVLETPIATVLYRQMENLDRGIVAMMKDEGVFISWRLLGTESKRTSFNLYRDGVKANTKPITSSTNYFDADGTINSTYYVCAMSDDAEKQQSELVTVWDTNHISVPIEKPESGITPDGEVYSYEANDASAADLDGDGKYEIVLKWYPSNAKDNSQSGYTGNTYLDAYKLDGTRMWRIDLGKNIRSGAHYTQFMVYDLDGDGRAEVACKTADGTIDGEGSVIGDADADYRNSSGYVLLGDEYLTIFDGLTGKELATTDYDPPRGNVSDWGDSYGNRVDRFLAAIAYIDGEKPSLVMCRGYYTRTVLAAYNWRDEELTKIWRFDTNDEENSAYYGQGNHNLSVADVDKDGKDEIIYGACAIDDDGTGLYSTGLGHGDAMHLGDLDPDREGMEVFQVHEPTDSTAGLEFRDADSGELIWGVATGIDTGRGAAGDIDPRYKGEEVWAVDGKYNSPTGGLYTAQGEYLSDIHPSSTNFSIWWDGDLLRELMDDNRVDKWDYLNSTTNNIFTATECSSNNGTKATPVLQADIFGDWREEIILKTTDSSALNIYSTTDMTEHKIYTLMHDPVYRLSIAWQNTGYNQPPHTSFYLGDGMANPPKPRIYIPVPTQLAAKNITNSTVKLKWKSVVGAESYNIYRQQDGCNEYILAGNTYKEEFNDKDLNDGTKYSYKVTAIVSSKESCPSLQLTISTIPYTADILILKLTQKVQNMDIDSPVKISLVSKLKSILKTMKKYNKNTILNKLNAFLNEVNALSGKKLTVEQAEDITVLVNKIIDTINSTSTPNVPGRLHQR